MCRVPALRSAEQVNQLSSRCSPSGARAGPSPFSVFLLPPEGGKLHHQKAGQGHHQTLKRSVERKHSSCKPRQPFSNEDVHWSTQKGSVLHCVKRAALSNSFPRVHLGVSRT